MMLDTELTASMVLMSLMKVLALFRLLTKTNQEFLHK